MLQALRICPDTKTIAHLKQRPRMAARLGRLRFGSKIQSVAINQRTRAVNAFIPLICRNKTVEKTSSSSMAGRVGAINLELISQLAASSFSLYKRSPTSTAASPQSLKPSPSRKSIVTPILLSKMSQQAEIKNGSPEVKEPSPKIPKLDHDSSDDGPTSLSFFFKVKKLSEKAVLPTRGSPLSAGYDLSSASEMKVPARGKALIPTDLSIAVPEGTYARIAPRSGLAWKHSIDVGAGVIDADYRGPVGVILFNYSDVEFEVKEGDRIAQLIIERIITPEVLEVEDLDATVRGEGGFGSTGV